MVGGIGWSQRGQFGLKEVQFSLLYSVRGWYNSCKISVIRDGSSQENSFFFGFTSMKNGWGIYIWAAEVRSQGDIIWGGDSVWGFCIMHFVSQINLIIDPTHQTAIMLPNAT